jgi:hypothetical protein
MNQFISVSEDLVVSGPSSYMTDGFPKWKADFERNGSAVFSYGVNHKGLTTRAALEVAIQTDYAAWKGYQQLRAHL